MACTRCQVSPTVRATAANGICWASISTSASNSRVNPESLPTQSGSTTQSNSRHTHLEVTLMLEEVQVTQLLDLRVVNRVFPCHLWMGKAGASREIDVNREPSLARVEIDSLHEPRRLDAKGRLKQLVGHQGCSPPSADRPVTLEGPTNAGTPTTSTRVRRQAVDLW